MRALVVFVALLATVYGQDEGSGCGDLRYQIGFSGTFTSMGFDQGLRYDRNAYCWWVLETSENLDMVVELEFDAFDVEPAVNCIYDSVSAFDGVDTISYPLLRKMCGHSLPNPTITTGPIMSVEFVSDSSVEYYGFSAIWSTRNTPVECDSGVTFRCGDDVSGYCVEIEKRCDGFQDCNMGEDEIGCPENSANCGRPVITPNTTSTMSESGAGINIIGGREAVMGSWPWTAALQRSFVHQCGGTIIDNRWILTAAHCVFTYRTNPQVWDVVSGNHIYTQPDPLETTHDVNSIFVHPLYNPFKEEYNFALLKIQGLIVFNDHHLDACLPAQDNIYPGGTETYITGWGDTTNPGGTRGDVGATLSGVLMQSPITLYNETYCNDPSRHNGEITATMRCGGPNDACTGDDGGPQTWYDANDDRWYVIGVIGDRTTREHNCADPNLPGIYGYVPSVSSWISDTMTNNPN